MNSESSFTLMLSVCGLIAIWLIVLTHLIDQHMNNLRLDVMRLHSQWLYEFTKKDEAWAEEFLEELWEEDAP